MWPNWSAGATRQSELGYRISLGEVFRSAMPWRPFWKSLSLSLSTLLTPLLRAPSSAASPSGLAIPVSEREVPAIKFRDDTNLPFPFKAVRRALQ